MRIVFFGSGEIGVPVVRNLLANREHKLVGVVTQPDRPVGRHQVVQPTAIKRLALEAGIHVAQPERLRRSPEVIRELEGLEPDLIVVFAYGQILPTEVLTLPRLDCVNVHTSLLPKYRGAAPISAAIDNGETTTGITIMDMDEGMDTGDILLQFPIKIRRRETAGTLHDRLALAAPAAVDEIMSLYEEDRVHRTPQDANLATYAPKMDRSLGVIDWSKSRYAIDCHVRAMNPWPGAFTYWQPARETANPTAKMKIKVFSTLPVRRCEGKAGEVRRTSERGILVAAGQGGGVLIRELQLDGKRRVHAADFLHGHRIEEGMIFG